MTSTDKHEAFRQSVRKTFRMMSDRALAFQDARIPCNGNISRQEIDAEINRRRFGS